MGKIIVVILIFVVVLLLGYGGYIISQLEKTFIDVIKPQPNESLNESFLIQGRIDPLWAPHIYFYIDLIDENNVTIAKIPVNSLMHPNLLDNEGKAAFATGMKIKFNTNKNAFLRFHKGDSSNLNISSYLVPVNFIKVHDSIMIKQLVFNDFSQSEEGIASWDFDKEEFYMSTNNEQQVLISTEQEIPLNSNAFSFEFKLNNYDIFEYVFEVFINNKKVYTPNKVYITSEHEGWIDSGKIMAIQNFTGEKTNISFRIWDSNPNNEIPIEMNIRNIIFLEIDLDNVV